MIASLLEDHICALSIVACFLLSILFVASLYIWNSPHDRNHPTTIKKRFCSVVVIMVISFLILKEILLLDKTRSVSIAESLGFRLPGLLPAIVLPLALTMVLFLGPMAMQGFEYISYLIRNPHFMLAHFKNLIWFRNIIFAPISEEFTFRACMMPLLLQCFKPMTAVFICALFFGLGHMHHMLERIKAGDPIHYVLIPSFYEFSYTTLFGAYSAFLFVKTGHFIAPVIVHSFCNTMGFPDFRRVFMYKNPKRTILIFLFVAGVVLWGLLLFPLTNPALYSNTIF